jgi:hypothetical protein
MLFKLLFEVNNMIPPLNGSNPVEQNFLVDRTENTPKISEGMLLRYQTTNKNLENVIQRNFDLANLISPKIRP